MGTSLIDFAKSYGKPQKQSLSDYARALADAGLGRERGDGGTPKAVDLSKPYGNVGDWDGLNPKMAQKLLALQQAWGAPLQLNSTFRSKTKNAKVGGAKRSQHLHGNAVDISVKGWSNEDRKALISLASSMGIGGIGVYTNAIHVDIAARRAWGPTYSSGSVPGWARGVIRTHMKNGFAGQTAELARGTVTDVAAAGEGVPLPERKGNPVASGRGRIGRGRNGYAAVETTPGSTVTSPVSGTVLGYHPDFRSYRGTAIIKGADGSYTMVTGLQSGTVKSGDQVEAGDPIGLAGKDVGVAQKGPDGNWSKDASGLLAGVQSAGTEVAQGNAMDGGALGLFGGGVPAPSEATRPSAPSPLGGELGMGGMQGMGRPSAASQVARALSAPSMDAGLMGGAPAPAASEAAPSYGIVSMNDPEVQAAFARATPDTPALDRSYSSFKLGAIPGDQENWSQGVPAAPALSAMTEPANMAELNAPTTAAQFGALPGMGSPPTALGLVSPIGDVTSADSYGFEANDPSMAIADVSPAAASALGGQSQFSGIGAPDAMAYSGPSSQASTAMGLGSFGGIGTPTADQAEAQRGYQEGMAAALGAPPAPERKVDAFAPGLRGFKDAFTGSVKSVGPKAAKAFAAAFATPSLDNQMAAIDATRAYSKMDGIRNNPAVLGLRSQQIGDYAMANPAVAGALGLSMGQQGTGPLSGGLGSDPFGGGVFGGNGPVSSGAGGMGGMQGMGRASGPDGPGMGTMGGTIGGTSPSGGNMGMGGMGLGGAPGGYGGPLGGGTQGNVIGNGNQGMGGMSGMGGSSTGAAVTGRGPSSNPGSGGGLSASQAAAIGAALSGAADAAAAASSDAARGFGGYGGYGGFF